MTMPVIKEVPSVFGPQPTIYGLYSVTAGPGAVSVHGPHYYEREDAQALARWALNAGRTNVTIRRSEDFSATLPIEEAGEAYWPPKGRQYVLRDGRIVTLA